jgi:hypothetical protein
MQAVSKSDLERYFVHPQFVPYLCKSPALCNHASNSIKGACLMGRVIPGFRNETIKQAGRVVGGSIQMQFDRTVPSAGIQFSRTVPGSGKQCGRTVPNPGVQFARTVPNSGRVVPGVVEFGRTVLGNVRQASRVIPGYMELDQMPLDAGHTLPSYIELSRVTPLSKQCGRISPNSYQVGRVTANTLTESLL